MKKENVEKDLSCSEKTDQIVQPVFEVSEDGAIAEKPKKSFFHIKERGSSIGREILAGVIVFLAMIYILPVNSGILGGMGAAEGLEGMSALGVFAATALASGLCTLIMGLVAGYPVMLSAGMGMNAFIAFTVCGSMGYTWIEALVLILVAGILFLAMSLTPIRKWIINSIPEDLKRIISAGLGCFICFVGLKGSGIITADAGTLVAFGDLTNPSVLLGVFGVILVFVLMAIPNKRIKQLAIVIAMATTAVIGVICGLCGVEGMPSFDTSNGWFAYSSLPDVFGKCFNGKAWLNVLSNVKSYALIFVLIFVNLFDTTATLVAVGKDAGFMDEKGQLVGGNKAMLADAVGAVICAPLGTSTVTSFAESSVGIEVGARTGLAAVTTGVLFLLSPMIYPVFSVFSNSSVTCMALVAVGALIVTSNFKDINWNDKIIGITAFLMVVMMMLTYSLSNGLGFGLIIYCLMMLVSKRGKEVNIALYIIALFFIANFAVNALI